MIPRETGAGRIARLVKQAAGYAFMAWVGLMAAAMLFMATWVVWRMLRAVIEKGWTP